MEVTGTVARISRRRTSYGCTHASALITRPGSNDIRLRYLEDGTPKVRSGQVVTITGMAMVGFKHVNIGGVTITIHPED